MRKPERIGYVFLHRKLIDSRVFQNEGLLKAWIWCLLRANHEEAWVNIKTGRGKTEVHVLPGQFIFGRNTAAKELKMNPSTVWKRILKLKKLGNCDIQSGSHYSIISIVNWHIYQAQKNKSNNKSDRQVTSKDTDKNVKNVEKFKSIPDFPDNSKKYLDLISTACEKIKLISAKNYKRFNVYNWVQVQINNNRHPEAIYETLTAVADYWAEINDPWAYANSIIKTKNQNWNEKEHIEQSQKLKEKWKLDPEVKKLISGIG